MVIVSGLLSQIKKCCMISKTKIGTEWTLSEYLKESFGVIISHMADSFLRSDSVFGAVLLYTEV